LSALYRGPWDVSASGILRYHSATPYTDWSGVDLNNDSYAFDLPAGVSHVNTLRGDSFSQVDVRLAKAFKFTGNYGVELIGEIFNLLNSKNGTRFVRDPGQGTCYLSASCSYSPTVFAGDTGQGEQRLAQLGLRVRF